MMSTTTTDLTLLAQRMKALGDEKRLRILLQLAGGERCVCDLMEDLGAAQSLLSFHLRTLKEAGLVTDRRQGRWVHYSLNPGALADVEEFLAARRGEAELAASPGTTCCDTSDEDTA
ncbi:MAG TPA: metalloregulator ArsR/SmtB family transcription factor [Longimicrobiales bacterium]|nr:metalloregulator ArsR/SmtB family transcription factor [Longimicrobiales bacterium]